MKLFLYLLLLVAAMLMAGVYGALHDQISYTVSPEYFTEFKVYEFKLMHSPLPMRAKAALIGFLASWWMGLPIGLLVGAAGFIHARPRAMLMRTLTAYGVTAGVALCTGVVGLMFGLLIASPHPADYPGWFIPSSLARPDRFLAVAHMHNFSYLGGVIGLVAGLVFQVLLYVMESRCTKARAPVASGG